MIRITFKIKNLISWVGSWDYNLKIESRKENTDAVQKLIMNGRIRNWINYLGECPENNFWSKLSRSDSVTKIW